MRDRITLTGMRFEGHLGAGAEERALSQLVEVDLEVEADLSAAARSDSLEDSVDYAPLIELTRRTVEDGSFALLERLAGAIAEAVLAADARIEALTVRVRKLALPMDVDIDHAQVELRRERSV